MSTEGDGGGMDTLLSIDLRQIRASVEGVGKEEHTGERSVYG